MTEHDPHSHIDTIIQKTIHYTIDTLFTVFASIVFFTGNHCIGKPDFIFDNLFSWLSVGVLLVAIFKWIYWVWALTNVHVIAPQFQVIDCINRKKESKMCTIKRSPIEKRQDGYYCSFDESNESILVHHHDEFEINKALAERWAIRTLVFYFAYSVAKNLFSPVFFSCAFYFMEKIHILVQVCAKYRLYSGLVFYLLVPYLSFGWSLCMDGSMYLKNYILKCFYYYFVDFYHPRHEYSSFRQMVSIVNTMVTVVDRHGEDQIAQDSKKVEKNNTKKNTPILSQGLARQITKLGNPLVKRLSISEKILIVNASEDKETRGHTWFISSDPPRYNFGIMVGLVNDVIFQLEKIKLNQTQAKIRQRSKAIQTKYYSEFVQHENHQVIAGLIKNTKNNYFPVNAAGNPIHIQEQLDARTNQLNILQKRNTDWEFL